MIKIISNKICFQNLALYFYLGEPWSNQFRLPASKMRKREN